MSSQVMCPLTDLLGAMGGPYVDVCHPGDWVAPTSLVSAVMRPRGPVSQSCAFLADCWARCVCLPCAFQGCVLSKRPIAISFLGSNQEHSNLNTKTTMWVDHYLYKNATLLSIRQTTIVTQATSELFGYDV
jgi:hypothetical protein